jgi:hypothetical protein
LALRTRETGTVGLRVGGDRVERRAIDPRDLRVEIEMRGGDRPRAPTCLERDRRGRGDPLGRVIRLAESRRERHGEAGRVRRGDQLLGIRSGSALEPCRKRIAGVLGTPLADEIDPRPCIQIALPDGGCVRFIMVVSPS